MTLPYSRAMEREADDIGMRIMSRACFDPGAGPRVMRMFQHYEDRAKQLAEEAAAAAAAASSSSSSSLSNATKATKWREQDALRIAEDTKELNDTVMAYLSTHPLNNERVEAMRAGMSRSLVGTCPLNPHSYITRRHRLHSTPFQRHLSLPTTDRIHHHIYIVYWYTTNVRTYEPPRVYLNRLSAHSLSN